jgi:[ribosomal protein S5]-alanine N-acetyltransferase
MSDQDLPVVSSQRLDLVLMTPAFFARCLAGEHAAAAAELGAAIDDEWWGEPGIMRFWLNQLLADPGLQLWLARAIVRREDRRMIGHIGFHGPPGMAHLEPYTPGGVEMGYTVFAPYRRQGYAAEALEALMLWAARAHGVPSFALSIAPANVASQALARRFGFVKVGEHEDPEDGLEEIFARSAP